MDQSFNDQELSDIMKEIEALEQDFEATPENKVSPIIKELAELEEEKALPTSIENVVSLEVKKVQPMLKPEPNVSLDSVHEEEYTPVAEIEDVEEFERLGEESPVAEVEVEAPMAEMHGPSTCKPTPMPTPIKSEEFKPSYVKSENTTSMTFKVQGSLTLDMKFEIGGKIVCLEVTETGLTIQLEGGMKFTVPVTETHEYKKAV
jgi:hypothetical protein